MLTVVILFLMNRDGDSAKASEKRALTKQEKPTSDEVTVAIEKPSFLKLNKEGKATTTTTSSLLSSSLHIVNVSTG